MDKILLILTLFFMAIGCLGIIFISWIVYDARYRDYNERRKKK